MEERTTDILVRRMGVRWTRLPVIQAPVSEVDSSVPPCLASVRPFTVRFGRSGFEDQMSDALPLIVMAFLAGSLTAWVLAIARLVRGKPLLPYEPRQPVPWGLVDLGLILLVLMGVVGSGLALARREWQIPVAAEMDELEPQQQAIVFVAFSMSTLIATAFCFVLLAWRVRARPADFGVQLVRLGHDIRVGLAAFLMLIVPVLLLQLLLTRWFPTRHPLIELLRQSPSPGFLCVAAFAAVVAAPVFEESLFRLFLQGWLEKMQVTRRRNATGQATSAECDAVIIGDRQLRKLAAPAVREEDGLGPPAPHHWSSERELDNPYSATQPADGEAVSTLEFEPSSEHAVDEANRPGWLPVVVSAILFSLAHFSNGPDWIPLFFLALGLGYLYQRTHRIQPCLVVHILVNALAVAQLWLYVRDAAG